MQNLSSVLCPHVTTQRPNQIICYYLRKRKMECEDAEAEAKAGAGKCRNLLKTGRDIATTFFYTTFGSQLQQFLWSWQRPLVGDEWPRGQHHGQEESGYVGIIPRDEWGRRSGGHCSTSVFSYVTAGLFGGPSL
jgi:hypothetical protein